MGIFSSIKNAIFGGNDAAPAGAAMGAAAAAAVAPAAAAAAPVAAAPAAVVDIAAVLAAKAGADKLNWRGSIVDLMKLLGMDASLAERKELADELGYTGAKDGSAEMNIWLHKAVMKELAANGGQVPAELLD
jgi:hypothetical protein